MSETHNIHLLCSEEADIRNCVIEDSQSQLEEALKDRDQWRECAEMLAAALKLEASHPDSGWRRVGTTDALAEFERLKEASK